MDPQRSNRILRDWSAIAGSARRPAAPPRGVVVRSGIPGLTLAGGAIVAAALVIGVAWLGSRGPSESVGGTPPPGTPIASPAAPASPTPAPTIGPCDPGNVAARITMWEGAAGHRIAHVELRTVSPVGCTLEAMDRPQLVDGSASILIDGVSPTTTTVLTVEPGDVVTTLVQAGNYCGAEPQPPVSVSFVLDNGRRIVAAPVSPTDATVPPCLGEGQPATIEMHPWSQ